MGFWYLFSSPASHFKILFFLFFFLIHNSRNSEGIKEKYKWGVCLYDICDQILKSKKSVLWKWCLKISREIGHFLPRFRFERNESRDAEHVLSSRSSQDREHVISSRSYLTWGEQVPMMFSAQNNSSSCMFSFTFFFSMKI